MNPILLDRIGRLSFVDGIVRIECLMTGPDGKPQVSGTLLLPAAQAGKTLTSLAKSLQDLRKKVQAKGGLGKQLQS